MPDALPDALPDLPARRRRARRGRRTASWTATAVLVPSLALVAGPAGPASAAGYGGDSLVVVRVGTGPAALSSAATEVFLDEFSPGGVALASLPLPTAAAGGGSAFTLSGTATSEGALALSADGRYLTLGGYGAAPGTAAVASTTAAAVSRVVARVDGAGVVDTSTGLGDAHSGSNIRGVATDDGARFWTTGGTGGIRLSTLGGTTSAVVSGATTVANFRVPVIADGQLYVSSASGAALGVSRVGTGLPTSGAGLTPLLSPAPAGPYGVVPLDRNTAVAGVDTLYVADDSATGGVLKYSFDGTTWTARGSFRPAGEGARGLAGRVAADGSVELVATTTTTSANRLVRVVDTAASDAVMTATDTTLAQAPVNTAFRGVAFAPQGGSTPTAPTITVQPDDTTVSSGQSATLRVSATGAPAPAYQWYQGTGGDTSTPVGTDAASFTTPPLTATTTYWVRVSNAGGSADSRTATVSVDTAPPCTATDLAIGAVQGTTDLSPLAGQTVTVQGTVVGDYEGPSPALRGFYLQDGGDGDVATSDGLFVFDNLGGASPDLVRLGDVVQVSGPVSEFQGQTQVSATALEVCAQGAGVTATDVTLPRVAPGDLEPYEGMLVRFPQTLRVTEHFQLGRFGQVVVSGGDRLRQPTARYPADDPRAAALQVANSLDRIIVDDAQNGQNPDPILFGRGGSPLSASNTLRGGDTLTDPVGVLTYTWAGNAASGNAFRLRPVDALGGSAQFVAANPRPTGTPDVGGNVRVAGANLLNFFNTFGTTACSFGVGGAVAECRGAGNTTEYDRQVAKEVAALTSIRGDVLAVQELENDGYGPGSAIQALVDAVNSAEGAATWAFVDVDAATGVVNAAGADAIKVALLYKPASVMPVPGTTQAYPTAGVFERNPVAQTFALRGGARFTVVANHFKSKGSCPTDPTNPDADAGDGQGCWNTRRTLQADALATWVAGTVVPAAGSPDVLVLGDLNSYAEEDPILSLEGSGFTNLVEQFGGDEAYSYVFDGQWGYLDHALASASLQPRVSGLEELHINADEPSVLDYNTEFKSAGLVSSLYAPDRFRTADHDPVVVGLQLGDAPRISGDLPAGTVGRAYSTALTLTGTAPVSVTVTAGALPAGLSLSADGVLSGTPTVGGSSTFTVTATNGYGSAEATFTVEVARAVSTTVVTSSAPDVLHRGAVGWTAAVQAAAGAPVPTGTVQFLLDGSPYGAPVALVGALATSPATATLPPGATAVTAVYSGDASVAGGKGGYRQAVRFAVAMVSPTAGEQVNRGSTVQIRFRLTDAVGRVPDALALTYLAGRRVSLAVSGAQMLASTCALRYDPVDDLFSYRWKTAKHGGAGAVTAIGSVTYPGLATPTTGRVTFRLR